MCHVKSVVGKCVFALCLLFAGVVQAQPASIVPAGNTAQSAAVNSVYAAPLSVVVKDSGSNPVSGASVQFDLPASGASGTFPGAVATAVATTDVDGVATSPTVTANATVGTFFPMATVTGVATPASFSLLNTNGAAYTIVVTPTTPDWTFVTESGTGAHAFVTGPATPRAGTGSVELQAVSADAGELYYTQQFAGMRLDTLKGLQFSTFVAAGTNNLAFNLDVDANLDIDANLAAPTSGFQGRLVFVPGLIPGAVIPGVWQTWDAMTQKGWYFSRAPLNALCSLAAPCTLAQVLAVCPNAGVIAQYAAGATTVPGILGFKLGNNGATGTVSADKLVLVREGPPATLTAWTYDFEPVSPAPATVTATAGTPQSTPVSTAFAAPLSAEVRDAASQLLSGVTVTFGLPASGSSGTFPGSAISATAVTTSVLGQADSPVVTANGLAGTYAASATAGAASAASYALTNTVGPPASIAATGGTPQSTIVATAFGGVLQATVKDAGNNPVPGATVTFTLPASGASGKFPGALSAVSATTNASGVAVSPTVTANATIGSYSATASVTGVATPATFSLQNTAPTAVATLTVTGGNAQTTRVSTAFATPLTVKATDSGGNPVPFATVQFAVPTLGASATLSASSAVTDANGLASITAAASAISGAYQVAATAGTGSANISLVNGITISVGNACGGIGATNADLVEQYYAAILRRPSDAGGKTYWMSETDRLCALGVDPKQTFLVMGEVFFNSPEYAAQNRDDTGFVTDLYITFFSRLPDTSGLNYWLGQITAGMPRNLVLNAFLFSPEFTATMNSVFPGRTARAETYLVMNLYGGFFRRLADTAGYSYWNSQFRTAQCAANPTSAMQATVNNVSTQFLTSTEYVARNTTNSQYVQDLYYAMLQRGGDLPGFNFWVGQLTSNAQTRNQVRAQFVISPEMAAQSVAIAAQGCLP
jgi:hypothetical protein